MSWVVLRRNREENQLAPGRADYVNVETDLKLVRMSRGDRDGLRGKGMG